MAATGAVSLYHVIGVTPGWTSEGKSGVWREGRPEETTTIEQDQLSATYASLTISHIDVPDLAFIGCPHCSLREIEEVTRLMEGRRAKKGVRFRLCTSRRVGSIASKKGLITRLEAAGV